MVTVVEDVDCRDARRRGLQMRHRGLQVADYQSVWEDRGVDGVGVSMCTPISKFNESSPHFL